ncbi:hypothetical protein Ahy_A05g024636 isoform C [Arachis hypogaea]|uniref:Pentatricopeptide repeat-containing protein n=1 Tax=Arachis hypogaea TaxID=3818 RepID=A0A445D6Y2_ARAHY|nr:hypothetical protein Ahy_A05g024636 isoform C [Arachis hypogaea]
MKMLDKHLEPDIVTQINMVGCYGKAGMVEGIKPCKSLFKAIIDGYQVCNRKDLAELVSREMKITFNLEENNEVESKIESENGSDCD